MLTYSIDWAELDLVEYENNKIVKIYENGVWEDVTPEKIETDYPEFFGDVNSLFDYEYEEEESFMDIAVKDQHSFRNPEPPLFFYRFFDVSESLDPENDFKMLNECIKMLKENGMSAHPIVYPKFGTCFL